MVTGNDALLADPPGHLRSQATDSEHGHFWVSGWEPHFNGLLYVGGLGAASCPSAWGLQMLM